MFAMTDAGQWLVVHLNSGTTFDGVMLTNRNVSDAHSVKLHNPDKKIVVDICVRDVAAVERNEKHPGMSNLVRLRGTRKE